MTTIGFVKLRTEAAFQGGEGHGYPLLDQFGFGTVAAGQLTEGWRIQRDTPGYGPRRTAEELRRDLAVAKRYADHTRFRNRCSRLAY